MKIQLKKLFFEFEDNQELYLYQINVLLMSLKVKLIQITEDLDIMIKRYIFKLI